MILNIYYLLNITTLIHYRTLSLSLYHQIWYDCILKNLLRKKYDKIYGMKNRKPDSYTYYGKNNFTVSDCK